MKKTFCLCALLAVLPLNAFGQAPIPPDDHTVQITPGLYDITWGTMGLNVGLSVGPDGLLLIDAQDEPAVPRLVARIASISDRPVRYVIDSHWHFDHVGGNATFAQQGAVIIAQDNTRIRLMTEQPNPLGNTQRAFPPAFWPTVTFNDRLTLHVNGEDIALTHFPNSHTDADVVAFFPKADVLFAADLFNNGDYTRVDLRGGSLAGMIAAYDQLLPMLDDKVKVVPGRGQVGSKSDLIAYREVMVTLRDRITGLINNGVTSEQAVAVKPTRDFDARWANGPVRPDQIVEEIYADLKRSAVSLGRTR